MTTYARAARLVLAALVAGALYAAPAQADNFLIEDFDDVSTLGASGWVQVNDSAPALPGDPWFQGNSGVFDSESGAPDSYIATNFASAGFGGVVSNWLLLPELTLNAFNQFTFSTRSAGAFPDRLEVRLSTNGASTSLGDFSTLLLPINPALNPGGYPSEWTHLHARPRRGAQPARAPTAASRSAISSMTTRSTATTSGSTPST